jgi:hypothetical protein
VSVDTQCYVLVYFNITEHIANNYPIAAVASTPITTLGASGILGEADLQECYDALPTGDLIAPIKAYVLEYGQTTIAGRSKDLDVRQFINVPSLSTAIESVALTSPDSTIDITDVSVAPDAAFEIDLADEAVTIPKLANDVLHVAAAAPTINDDSGDGYAVGSRWINTTTDKEYVLTDATVGAAVWVETTGTSFSDQAANMLFAGPTIGSDAPPSFRMMHPEDIPVGIVGPSKLASGTPYAFIGYDGSGNASEQYPVQIVFATWGEGSMAVRNAVYLDESTNKWKKIDTDSLTPLVGTRCGFVLDAGTGAINTLGLVITSGILTGFSGLTPGAAVYASTTAGGMTQTPPTVSAGGGQVCGLELGWAIAATLVMVNPRPAQYMKRESLAANATTTLVHHSDPAARLRLPRAAVNTIDTAVIETSGGAQDSSSQLKGQSGAGGTTTPNAVGGTGYALGDAGGTDFRQAQEIQITAGRLSQITFQTRTSGGSPTGNATVSVRLDDGTGKPSTTILWSQSIAITSNATNTINITGGPFLDAATSYWIVWECDAFQGTNNRYVLDGSAASSYAFASKADSGAASFPGTWATTNAGDIRCSITTSAVVVNNGLAQGFSHSSTTTLSYVDLLLKRTGTLSGTLTLAVYSDSSGFPNAVITNGTAATVAASTVTTGYTLIRFTWSTPPTNTASTQYHLVLTTSDSASNTAYIEWGTDISSPPYANGAFALFNPTWSAASPTADGIFDLYGVLSTYGEPTTVGRWSGGTRDMAVRFDDGAGVNTNTNTTFKNTSGVTLDVTCIVEFP